MSQLPRSDERGTQGTQGVQPKGNHAFWLSGIGGFVLGALTVIIVLLLTRRAGDRDEPGPEARPGQQAVQHDAAPNAEAGK